MILHNCLLAVCCDYGIFFFYFHAVFSQLTVCKQNKNVASLLKNGSGTMNHMQMLSSIKIQAETKAQENNIQVYTSVYVG